MRGCMHIYCGDGKGKTTAAVGLAIRAAGAGKRVLFAQFLKDGTSSEMQVLRNINGVTVEVCTTPHGFIKNMDAEEKQRAKADFTALLEQVLRHAEEGADLLVLDEIIPACNHAMVEESVLTEFLHSRPEKLEVVLTGRSPSQTLLCAADYVTEMRKVKHPYDQGISARYGIEF